MVTSSRLPDRLEPSHGFSAWIRLPSHRSFTKEASRRRSGEKMEMFFLYRTNISHLAKRKMIKSAFERGYVSSQEGTHYLFLCR